MIPALFARRAAESTPRRAVVVLAALAFVLTTLGGLEMIAAFSSLTFLLGSIAVSVANLRLRVDTGSRLGLILLGMILMATTVILLIVHLLREQREALGAIAAIYVGVVGVELAFRRLRRVTARSHD